MTFFEAAVLGIIEAFTEYVPVSSTGHLILAGHMMGIEDNDFSKAFEIVIQGGSILAVILYYRQLLWGHFVSVLRWEKQAVAFFTKILIAFLPAAIVGLAFYSSIKAFLFGPVPVVAALIVGGIVMIVVERRLPAHKGEEKEISYKGALIVGICQVFSLWPGTSRAMTTLLGGRAAGLSPYKAAEFSFLLAIPVILAATFYDLYKIGPTLFESTRYLQLLGVGTLVSFVVSIFVIRIFLDYLKKHSLEVFGWYRIVIGVVFSLVFLVEW